MLICVSVNVFNKLHDLRLPLSCTCTSWSRQCFSWLKGRAAHTHSVGQHGWRQLGGRLSKYGQNESGTFTSSALRCVCVYLRLCSFSGEAQQVLTGPSSSPHSPYKPCFFVWMLGTVCACQQAWSALCGSDVNVIDSQAVTRAIESSCGKRETLEPHSFQPWGGEGDKNRERENPNRLKGYTGTLFE